VSDNAIIGVVMGGFGVLTWLLGLSYFLGRNTAKLDTLADSQKTTQETIEQIFQKLDQLSKSLPHQCIQLQSVAEMRAQIALDTKRIEEIESWRHSFEHSHRSE
jgi:hypothetical protein